METHCWTIIIALAGAVGAMAAYIAKQWAARSQEVKELNDEYKGMLREMLKELGSE